MGTGNAGLSARYYTDAQQLKLFLANGFDEQSRELVQKLRLEGVDAKVSRDGHVTISPLDGNVDDVATMIAARLEARKRKDFKESDRIRDELAKMGITLKDSKNKETGEIETTWEVAR
jgi:cysteinyl-tRNA synthetase